MAIYYFLKKNWLWLSASIAVLIIFHLIYGLQILEPGNISWLMTAMHDWGAHYLGWYFYRNEPWYFPLGEIHNLYYPVGTNMGLTDSIPLLAIFFKFFQAILPEDFQYFGIWLLLCHALAAYFTVRLLRLFKVHPLIIFIAVLFIIANPVLIYRGMHPAICAHWLLIASMYLYFLNPQVVQPKRILFYQAVLLILAGLITPYLCLMVFGFSLALSIRLWLFDKVVPLKFTIIYNIISTIALMAVWLVIGMIGINTGESFSVAGGYGLYSLNLNSLFNSFGFSTFLPALKQVTIHQYEGFMYLGLGIMLLLAFQLAYGIYLFASRKKQEKSSAHIAVTYSINLIPITGLFILLTLFSITNIVSVNDKVLFKIPIPQLIIKLGETFRASARFFWPVYYFMLIWCFIAVSKSKLPRPVKLSMLFIALIVQFYDTKRLFTYRSLSYGSYQMPIDEKNWNALISQFDEIVVYPPFQGSYLVNSDYQFFCYLAAKARKPVTTGYVSRENTKATSSYTKSLEAELAAGTISPNKIYITTLSNLEQFSLLIQSNAAQLHILDNYYYIYSTSQVNPSLQSLSQTLDSKQQPILDFAMRLFGTKNKFTKTNHITLPKESTIRFSLESLGNNHQYLTSTGWAFIDSTKNNKSDSIFFLLTNKSHSYLAPASVRLRPDVTAYFQKPYLDDAGYRALIHKDDVQRGTYQLAIAIKNSQGEWAYQAVNKTIKVGISDFTAAEKLTTLPPVIPDIKYNLESLESEDSIIKISGWAFFPKQDIDSCSISLVFINSGNYYKVETERIMRQDVTSYFKSSKPLDNAGFSVNVTKRSLPKGNYQVGILIEDSKNRKEGMILSGRSVEIQ